MHVRSGARFVCGVLLATVACGKDPGGGGESGSEGTTGAVSASTDVDPTADSSTVDPASSGVASSTADPSTSSSSGEQTTAELCPDLGDPCTICEASSCSQIYCDCYGNVECGALAACAQLCGATLECYQQCATEHPQGISDGALLTHCAATECARACPGFVPLTACQLCLYAECQPEMNVCVANPECTVLLQCLDACDDEQCINACYFEHPDGSGDAGPVGTCLQDACASECA